MRELPGAILAARETLRQAGVSGPYALALAAPIYAQVLAAAEDGYPLAKRLTQQVLDGPLVRAPAIEGGVLLSLRGGDYELHVGQDLSVGYAGPRSPDRRALSDGVVHVPDAGAGGGSGAPALRTSRSAFGSRATLPRASMQACTVCPDASSSPSGTRRIS